MEHNDPVVSIIVPTRNSSKTLRSCLESIENQTYNKIEIIVVDNYSTDRTINIAKSYSNKIYVHGPERSAQLNYGVDKALGKYIYRVDSDFWLDPHVVEHAVMRAEAGNHAAILIHNTSDPSISFWSRVRKFERDMYDSDDMNVAARFIRRDVFIAMGGFDTSLVAGEDYDLHNRIIKEYSIGRISPREIHLGEPKSLREIARKHYYYGKTISAFLRKNKERGLRQISPIRIAYLRHYKEFLKHPILAVGFGIYQSVRYSSGILGVVAGRMARNETERLEVRHQDMIWDRELLE
ncbi:MAG: glycosyltransferase [Nitrososphaera sp.]